MRNVPYSERIRNFVETNIQIYKIRNDYGFDTSTLERRTVNPLTGGYLPEELQEFTLSDLSNVWVDTVKSYLQNIGLESVDTQNGLLDGIRMYHTQTPAFGIAPPVSYRTPEEIRTGNYPQYTFAGDQLGFNDKQHLVDYLVSQLVQGFEVFLYSLEKSPIIYDPLNFQPTRKLMVRLKIVDWATKLNRTDFSFLKVKKNFTPTKIIPKFVM